MGSFETLTFYISIQLHTNKKISETETHSYLTKKNLHNDTEIEDGRDGGNDRVDEDGTKTTTK